MEPTTVSLHTRFRVGAVDPRIFGGFIEHMGRAVYEGLYDPSSHHVNEDGCRSDVLAALNRLRMTAMRYPGGNFASGYHWLDGVGPRDRRPVVRDMAWQSIEPNTFGTDEFISLCRKMDWTPMLTVNMGTGTPEEARNWVEYCNCPAGTRYANMRAAGGSKQPHAVKLWCLGNEMDGPWQIGHVPPEEYAKRAQQAAAMMKATDRSIELVVCGSCAVTLKTYMEWDQKVLEYMGDLADYVSLHRYLGNKENDTPEFLASLSAVDQQIEEMDAACRFVQAKRHSKKRPYLCFDEWNVWYKNMQWDGEGKLAPHLLEEVYNLEDALVAGGFLHSFIRHADVVRIANIAQIVNVIGMVMTRGDEMFVQSIFYPFEMFSSRREGVSLRLDVNGPEYETKNYGRVRFIDASSILGEGKLHVFLTNRSTSDSAPVTVAVSDRTIASLESGEILTGPDAKAANSFEQQNVVRSQPFTEVKVAGGKAQLSLPPLSLAAVTFRLA